jgi:histone chaperone ASF1
MVVNVLNVVVAGAREGECVVTAGTAPMEFELTLELTRKVESEMTVEWRMVYVFGDDVKDQILDPGVDVGPLEVSTMKFVFSGTAPNLYLVKKEDQLDVGAVYISGLYKGQEFVRIGYYVKHEYLAGSVAVDPVTGDEILPEVLQMDKVVRRVDAGNPRVTRFVIKWDDAETDPLQPPPVTYGDMEMDEPSEEEEDEEEEEEEEEEDDISVDVEEEEQENGEEERMNKMKMH